MFRFNFKKYMPNFDSDDIVVISFVFGVILFFYVAATAGLNWQHKHVTKIIGVENLKIDNTGRWIGSNNPDVRINFNDQRKVNRIMYDDTYTVIYTTQKNYKIKTSGEICNSINMRRDGVQECDPNNSKNRFQYTKNVYEIIEHDGDDVHHWVCSSNFGNCARYKEKN